MRKILIVDDEKAYVDVFSKILTKEGFKVLNAYNGEESIDLLRKHNPELVIIDYCLPGANGLETIKRIKKINNKCNFIMISGFEGTDLIKNAHNLGVMYCFSKPIKLDEVKRTIKDIFYKSTLTYLINLTIVNYNEFKKRINIEPLLLFNDLKTIIDVTFKRFNQLDKEKSLLVLKDIQNGSFSILFYLVEEKESIGICNLLINNIKNYFIKKKARGVFFNIGSLVYPHDKSSFKIIQFSDKLPIKRIYIGLEIRHFKRVHYNTNVKIFLPEGKTESYKTLNISEGGFCFIGEIILRIDMRINVRLEIPQRRDPLDAKARVAWVKKIVQFHKGDVDKYRAGLEFIAMEDGDKKFLSKFINSMPA